LLVDRFGVEGREDVEVVRMRGWGLAVVRVVAGIVFFMHGFQKLFLMGFGGVAGFLGGLGVPAPGLFAVIVTLVEFLCGLALIVGLFTRVVAILLALDMLVALLTVHLPGGFFITNGELPLMLLAAAIGLVLGGPGEAALDRLLAARTRNPTVARLTS
jgi:putative oxidoreductase